MRAIDFGAWAALLMAVPFAIVVATAFLKFAVVLAILRRAFGGSAVPPASVAAALALLFALFVTAPVAERVWAAAAPSLQKGDALSLAAAATRAAEPVRDFLAKHAPARERQSFSSCSGSCGRRRSAPRSARTTWWCWRRRSPRRS